MQKKNGFTLLEIMIVIAVLAVVFAFIGVGVLQFMRSSKQEQTLLRMDQDANRTLETIKQTLLSGYIPVAENPLSTGRTAALGTTNFAANVANWRRVLGNGADILVFLVAIDAEGDGDLFYQGGSNTARRMIMGLHTTERSAGVPDGLYEATSAAETRADPGPDLGIVDLDPVVDFVLPTDNGSPLDMDAARFNQTFAYPPNAAGRNHVYGVIRFAPYLADGANRIHILESEVNQDLNEDDDRGDEFVLGFIELVYPLSDGGTISQPISTPSILLQVNRDDDPQDSLFQLWPDGTAGNNIKVHLLVCDYLDQTANSWAFNIEGHQFITRTYESLLKLPLMGVE